MSEFMFGSYRGGHLSSRLEKAVEREFPDVSVVNYTEPRGEKRGWFATRNYGEPFDRNTARTVLAYARSIARGKDAELLKEDE